MNKTWNGDWKDRVRHCISQAGYRDAWSFAEENPKVPFGKLFRILKNYCASNETPICYSQFQSIFFEDAVYNDKLREAIIETLARRIRQHLPNGWNKGKNVRMRKADIISQWELPLTQFEQYSEIAETVWERIKIKNIPDDWCPKSRNDEILQHVFSEVWPQEKMIKRKNNEK